MNPIEVIGNFYNAETKIYRIIVQHGKLVAKKSIGIANSIKHLNPDLTFIEQAAILHDIGIFMTDAPSIGCMGTHPYVLHGYLGRVILEKEGLPKHALVCERHVGVGISVEDIEKRKLPLPLRSMVPVSIEEQIICYADKFFSKNPNSNAREKSIDEVITGLSQYGRDQVARFKSWAALFGDL